MLKVRRGKSERHRECCEARSPAFQSWCVSSHVFILCYGLGRVSGAALMFLSLRCPKIRGGTSKKKICGGRVRNDGQSCPGCGSGKTLSTLAPACRIVAESGDGD
ncbi:hypothetical protein C0J45_15918 [Silurus meridionalis]|nr:hypothetical protein C0J45_15918 [Silurus meridionalis]